jgi:hypothetical protein
MADRPIEEIDSKVAIALEKRVAEIANRLTVGKRGILQSIHAKGEYDFAESLFIALFEQQK